MIIVVLVAALAGVALFLCLISFIQMLYLESQRLVTRETRALEYFKETLEERIGGTTPRALLAFSLMKHSAMLALAMLGLWVAWLSAENVWYVIVEGAAASWLTMIVVCYVVPQLLYRRTTGRWAAPLAPMLRLLVTASRPLTATLSFFESLVELAEPESRGQQKIDPSEHIDALISAGEEEGIIAGEDRRLIESVVAFGDKTVREVMTPRPNIVAIDADRSLDDLRNLVIHEQFSRVPVYEETIDQIIGFVHVRDMFELDEQDRAERTIRDLLRPIRHVPETKPVNDLLREMQRDGAHMAIVVDEYGNTAGLATMEDLVEEILGEIHDEHEPDRDVREESEGSYVVAGSLDLDRLQDLLKFRAEEETESTTVGGLAAEWLGHVPTPGEAVERGGIRIEVLAGNELRVEQVRVSRTGGGENA